MKLNLVERTDRVVQVACQGKLTPLPTSFRVEPLADLLGPAKPGQSVVLDLSGADYINSTGISWLIQLHKQLGKLGGLLVLHSLTPQVREALDLVHLSSVFKIAADRPSALAQFGLASPVT